jgi:hypothetical protein
MVDLSYIIKEKSPKQANFYSGFVWQKVGDKSKTHNAKYVRAFGRNDII